MRHFLIIALCLGAMAITAGAEITPLINYQGRLTDDSGAPMADGNYLIKFKIYGSESGSDSLWSSGYLTVAVAGGLFSRSLGPLPNDVFSGTERYLGITVGTDQEISPRIQFTSVPYAFEAVNADTADYALLADNAATADLAKAVDGDFVESTGDTITGDLEFDTNGDGIIEGAIRTIASPDQVRFTLYNTSTGGQTADLFGTTYGGLALRHYNDGNSKVLLMGQDEGGRFELTNNLFQRTVYMDAALTGNSSVQLPDDAIDADEILDEPGLATEINQSLTTITNTTIYTTELDSVTIIPPEDGYVFVTARYICRFSGTTGINGGYVQVTNLQGAAVQSTSNLHGQYAFPSTETCYDQGYVDFIDNVDAGTPVTYYLQTAKWSSATGTFEVGRGRISAFYFPTSYEAVKQLVSDPSGFSNAVPITFEDAEGNTQTAYKVDLRELELKAKEAKIKALEAERELERARDEAELRDRQ